MYNAYWHWPTYLLFVLVTLLSLFFIGRYDRDENKSNKTLLLGLLPIFCLFFFRDESVGKDLVRYSIHVDNGIYELYQLISGERINEPFFTIIYFVSNLLGGVRPFIYLTSFFEFLFLFIAMRRFRSHEIDTRWIFLLFFALIGIKSFSMIRNGVSVACSLCAYSFLLDTGRKRWIGYLTYSIVAIGFHISAVLNFIIFALCYPPKYTIENMNGVVFKRCSYIFLFFLMVYIFGLNTLSDYLISFEEGRYERFAIHKKDLGLGNLITRIPFIAIVFYFMKTTQSRIKINIAPFILLTIADLFISQMKYLATDFERLTTYTSLAIPVMIAVMYRSFNGDSNRLIKYLCVVLTLYMVYDRLYFSGVLNESGCMPYHFMSL